MDEDINKGEDGNSVGPLTKEEVIAVIKDSFKNSDESLRYMDSIISNLTEPRRLEASNPRSISFLTWIFPVLMLFIGRGSEGQGKEPLKEERDEQDNKDGEGDSVEKSPECSQENHR